MFKLAHPNYELHSALLFVPGPVLFYFWFANLQNLQKFAKNNWAWIPSAAAVSDHSQLRVGEMMLKFKWFRRSSATSGFLTDMTRFIQPQNAAQNNICRLFRVRPTSSSVNGVDPWVEFSLRNVLHIPGWGALGRAKVLWLFKSQVMCVYVLTFTSKGIFIWGLSDQRSCWVSQAAFTCSVF